MNSPLLYEINTRCWLRDLSERLGRAVTLATVPAAELTRWQHLGFTHIWLMGLWSSGPRAREKALREPNQRRVYSGALPDWRAEDVDGSPYAIGEYRVPTALGGEEGLLTFRQQLREQGFKLLLDFVPNHLGLDHPWVQQRPELFVQSREKAPETLRVQTAQGAHWLAHGKDPYFAAWTDTVQLEYRRAETRRAMLELLRSVAKRCDGVRCDMAMLLLSEVFANTWKKFPVSADAPEREFWAEAISAIKVTFPDFLFLAEVYWGLEARLQQLGFDYTYDKELYDRLEARDAAGVQRQVLGLAPETLAAGAHFIENHDEARIASILTPAQQRAAALVILGLPGMRFLHEGQLTGARLRLPVQLRRRFPEPTQTEIVRIYEQLLTLLPQTAVGRGRGQVLVPQAAWPENPTGQNCILVQWQGESDEFDLVAVNLAPHPSQCYAPLELANQKVAKWSAQDLLGQATVVRETRDLQSPGLYLDLPAHGTQLWHWQPAL